MDEQTRREVAEQASAHLPPFPAFYVWSNADIEAMATAFRKRFDEEIPRTETLMAVAAIGYRIAMRDVMEGVDAE